MYSSSLVTVLWFTFSAIRGSFTRHTTFTSSTRSFFVGLHHPCNNHGPSRVATARLTCGNLVKRNRFLLWKVGQKQSFPTRVVGFLHIPTFLPSFPNHFTSGYNPPCFFCSLLKSDRGPHKGKARLPTTHLLRGQTVKPLGTQIFHLEVQALSWQKGKISLHIASTKKFTAAGKRRVVFFKGKASPDPNFFTVRCVSTNDKKEFSKVTKVTYLVG